MQVLDRHVLAQLADDLADQAFAQSFAERYRSMLPKRVSRVSRALTARDVDEAMDAVLSLRVSSSAVGAEELATLARRIEADLRCGQLEQAQKRCGHLGPAAARADVELATYRPEQQN